MENKHFAREHTWKPAALICLQQADLFWPCGWSKYHYLASFGLGRKVWSLHYILLHSVAVPKFQGSETCSSSRACSDLFFDCTCSHSLNSCRVFLRYVSSHALSSLPFSQMILGKFGTWMVSVRCASSCDLSNAALAWNPFCNGCTWMVVRWCVFSSAW